MNAASPEDEAAIEATKAPLLEHLVELRKRLIWSVVSFLAAFAVCFYFSRDIYAFLAAPLDHALAQAGQSNNHLVYLALPEVFFTYVKVGMFAGLCLAFPLIAAQVWLFVAPGLYKHERSAFMPFLLATPVLFVMGAAFCYYAMLPVAIRFFLGFEQPGSAGAPAIQLQARVTDYLDFVTTLIFAFGLSFELPVLLSLLGRVGIISAAQLRSMRRFAIVGVFAVAAVLTPPDIFSMLSLAFPLVLLYEISILCVALIERSRAREDAKRAQ